MQLGANLTQLDPAKLVAFAQRAEELGLHSLWRGEAYGVDAVVPLSWAAAHTSRIRLGSAILQIPARTPTMTGMTALALDRLTRGRFTLGVGMSGPQVVEGWHGVPYEAPVSTTEECIGILRRIFRSDEPLTYRGARYNIPHTGLGGSGLGKALRPAVAPVNDIPIYVAGIGPRNVAMATRVADGILPMLWDPFRIKEGFGDALASAPPAFAIAPTVPVAIGDDVAACRDKVRPVIALYVGGMGARKKNFYNALVRRYGFEEAAEAVQEAYLAGRREEAIRLVPDQLVDELALVGPKARVADVLEVWKASGITTLIVATPSSTNLETLAELML